MTLQVAPHRQFVPSFYYGFGSELLKARILKPHTGVTDSSLTRCGYGKCYGANNWCGCGSFSAQAGNQWWCTCGHHYNEHGS